MFVCVFDVIYIFIYIRSTCATRFSCGGIYVKGNSSDECLSFIFFFFFLCRPVKWGINNHVKKKIK